MGEKKQDGLTENTKVQEKTRIAHIKSIPLIPPENSFKIRSRSVKAFYLGQAGDTGFYEIPVVMPRYQHSKLMNVGKHIRPRSHDTHRPQKDIKELRQFIQMGFTKQFSEPGDPPVIFRGGAFIRLLVNDHRT